jgi:hypothetical protein
MAAATSTVSGLAGAALARRPAFSTSTCHLLLPVPDIDVLCVLKCWIDLCE